MSAQPSHPKSVQSASTVILLLVVPSIPEVDGYGAELLTVGTPIVCVRICPVTVAVVCVGYEYEMSTLLLISAVTEVLPLKIMPSTSVTNVIHFGCTWLASPTVIAPFISGSPSSLTLVI